MYLKEKIMLFFSILIVFSQSISAQTIETPVIQSISIDKAQNLPIIQWTYPNTSEINGYIIKRQIFGVDGIVDGSYVTVATINDSGTLTYTDITSEYGIADATLKSFTYRVGAFKINGVDVEYSQMSDPVNTLMLKTPNVELCEKTIALKWNTHHGWGDDLKAYVLRYTNGNTTPNILIDTIYPPDTSYVHENITIDANYYYLVDAIHADGHAIQSSNIRGINTYMPNPPQFLIADYATVTQPGSVALSFTVDPVNSISSYKIMHKAEYMPSKEFEILTEIPYTGQDQITYVDQALTSTYIKEYKLIAVNICGDDYMESNSATNIVVRGAADDEIYAQNNLKWNLYQKWGNGIAVQEIYRSIDNGAFELITSLSGSENEFTDDVSAYAGQKINGKLTRGNFCYMIIATENQQTSGTVPMQSQSNIMCIQQRPRVFIPNAFNPNSSIEENRTFMPVISFLENFSMTIYNRWGEKLFETKDVDTPWNGTDLSGNLVQQGTYIYYIRYQKYDNEFIEESGPITVVY